MRRLAALLTALAAVTPTDGRAAPPHHAPGGGFRNPVPVELAGPLVTVPFFARRVLGAFHGRPGAPPAVPNDGVFLRDNARHSVPTATWIGHSTVLVQMDHTTVLTDPIWSSTASPVSFAGPRRFVPPALPMEKLPPVDLVLVSHSHYDHLDVPTLRSLARSGTHFFVPLGVGDILRGEGIGPVEEFDWWEHRTVGNVEVYCVPSRHWSARSPFDRDRTLWAGWVVVGPTRRFYFAGDTGWFDGFAEIGRRLGPFGLAALPIGAYAPPEMMQPVHLNPEEAVRAGEEARAERLLGIHYGTFDLTDEPLDEPPRRFHAAAARRGLAPDRVWTPPLGETRRW